MNLTEYLNTLLQIPEGEELRLEIEPAFRFELPWPKQEGDDGDA